MRRMPVKKARKLRDGLLAAGAAVMLAGAALNSEAFLIVGAVLAVACLVPHFLHNRCPHCGKQLGNINGRYCPFCGGKLDEEE